MTKSSEIIQIDQISSFFKDGETDFVQRFIEFREDVSISVSISNCNENRIIRLLAVFDQKTAHERMDSLTISFVEVFLNRCCFLKSFYFTLNYYESSKFVLVKILAKTKCLSNASNSDNINE